MMNRGVLKRQMFAKGGAAFPDLNKDGNITQADILMGRGVEFKQEGGIAGMMQPPAAAQLDPQVVDQMLTAASQTTGDLEGAQDFEQMMNMVRGDDASMGERREELAGVVGPEDAMQTPESVLALVQPVMQIAAVDQGIGELAQQEMQQPMQGPMAGGIMENVAPPAAPAPVPMGGPPPVNFKDGGLVRRGDNQPVQKFQFGGTDYATLLSGTVGDLPGQRFRRMMQDVVFENAAVAEQQAAARAALSPAAAAALPKPEPKRGDGSRLRELMEAQRELYREYGLGDPAARAAEREDQRKMTQAQMLFDIANTALTFAAPMQGERAGLSPAERLAMAATQTQLPQTIGARAQAQLEADRASKKEERTLDLAALQSAETKLAAEVASQDARDLALAKKTPEKADRVKLVIPDGDGEKVVGTYDLSKPADVAKYDAKMAEFAEKGINAYPITASPRQTREREIVLYNEADGSTSPIFDIGSEAGRKARDAWKEENPLPEGQSYREMGPPTAPAPDRPISERDFFKQFGYSYKAFGELSADMQKYVRGLPVLTDKDFFAKYGMTKAELDALDPELKKYFMGFPVLTDKDYFAKYGMDKAAFDALPVDTKNRLSKVSPEREIRVINDQIIDVTEGSAPVAIFGDPEVKTLTVGSEVIDITDPNDVKVIFGNKKRDIRVVRGELVEIPADGGKPIKIFGERVPPTGTFENMILKTGENIIVKKVGDKLYDKTGAEINLNTDAYDGAVLVSKDKAFMESKMASSQAAAGARLEEVRQQQSDRALRGVLGGNNSTVNSRVEAMGGQALSPETNAVVFDALNAARQGVGFYNKLKQSVSEYGGALVPALQNAFADKVEAGNFIDSVFVLGRVALAQSPRFAEGEQTRLADLFPSTQRLLANPENAVRKLVGLKRMMQFELEQNLQILANSTDRSIRRQAEQSVYAIDGVLKMLETIPDRGVVSTPVADETIQAIMQSQAAAQGSN
jgi:hypothetical protein